VLNTVQKKKEMLRRESHCKDNIENKGGREQGKRIVEIKFLVYSS
jgi:hypothetical protein